MRRLLLPSLLIGALLTGCSTFESGEEQGPPLPPDMARQANGKTATAWPVALGDTEVRKRVARLLPPGVKDKAGWAEDLHTAFKVLEVPHASQTYCAAIAIIEQESSFQAAPVVPGKPSQLTCSGAARCAVTGISVPWVAPFTSTRMSMPSSRMRRAIN